jgi:lauroyl/myristoyl acyltransferase
VLAWIAGGGAYCILKRERDIATQSLTRVFGAEKTPAQIQKLVRRVFRHTASVIIDWVILRRWRREKLERAFPNVVASVLAAEAEIKSLGTGVIAITAHCGNWEMLALFFSRFAPGLLATVAKRLYFEKYNAFLHRLRTEQGFDPTYSDESPRKMISRVQDGRCWAFRDQDLRTNSGVFVDFFAPAYTVTFPIEIARKMASR